MWLSEDAMMARNQELQGMLARFLLLRVAELRHMQVQGTES